MEAHPHPIALRWLSRVCSITLIAAAPITSFWHPVAAGYLLLVGVMAYIDWTQVQKVALSTNSISFERFERKVQDAEQLLKKIAEVEERISFVLTEQMLNRGAQYRPNAGFCEEAEFAIYGALKEMNGMKVSPLLKSNMEELKRDLGFQLCNGIFGQKWLKPTSAANIWASSEKFEALPDRNKIHELASMDGVDLARVNAVLDAYMLFKERDVVPPKDLVRLLYTFKNYSNSPTEAET